MDIYFNTGRRYTKDGQIIRAVFDAENEKVHFADFSRAIHGTFEAPSSITAFRTPGGLAAWVMERYDRGDKRLFDMRSMEMLMMEGRDMSAKVHDFQL